MNIFQTVGAIAIALGTTMAQATIAPPTIVGNTSTYSENFNGGSSFSAGWFNAPFTADDYMWITSPVGSNSSNYSFTSGAAISSLTVSFYYSAFSAQQAGAASWNLTGPSSNLPNTGNALLVSLNNPGSGNSNAVALADQFITQTWSNLAAGTYSLNFATAGFSELKVDDVKIAVTAVPEPETYAMLLTGLGLMGAVARRRKAKQA